MVKLIVYRDGLGSISDVFVDDREVEATKMMLEQEGCKILAVEEHKGKLIRTVMLNHDRETEAMILQAIKVLEVEG